MTTTTYDVDRVRAQFPALAHGIAHFDGPGGSQVPSSVARAVADTMTGGLCQRGTLTETERRTDAVTRGARAAVGDLLGVDPAGVVFGRSMTQLTMDMARTLAASQEWGPGDEVVVSRLDHDSNIRPWVLAAESVGATVRWLDFDPATAEVADIETVLTTQTRLVALTAASNLFGTRPDVPAVAAAAHEVGALVYVDAVHLTPHAPVDATALGADLLACSPYKFFGPHLGVLAAAPALLETLRPAKLLPSTDAVPERFELGTLPYELLAGVTAAVDFIAGLDPAGSGRRADVVASMASVEAHEDALLVRLLDGLRTVPGVTLHGSPRHRTPTALFSVAGRSGREVQEGLAAAGVNAPSGSFYAQEA
jgi:cysteine desulfurase family protein (TIGR01976 family)